MDEYIKRDDALKAIESCAGWSRPIESAYEDIQAIPAADVESVVHAQWIFNDDWWEFRCTNCRNAVGNIKKYNYCPNCGAKMDK